MQKKKRVNIDYEPLKITDGYIEPPADQVLKSRSNIEHELQLKKNVNRVSNFEYVLLGPQDKLSSNNIPYILRKPIKQFTSENEPTVHILNNNASNIAEEQQLIDNHTIIRQVDSKLPVKSSEQISPEKSVQTVYKNFLKLSC